MSIESLHDSSISNTENLEEQIQDAYNAARVSAKEKLTESLSEYQKDWESAYPEIKDINIVELADKMVSEISSGLRYASGNLEDVINAIKGFKFSESDAFGRTGMNNSGLVKKMEHVIREDGNIKKFLELVSLKNQ